jgi:hypothetical protein
MKYAITLALIAVLQGCGSNGSSTESIDHTETNPFETVEQKPELAEDTSEQPNVCFLEECDAWPRWDGCTRDVPASMCWLDGGDE